MDASGNILAQGIFQLGAVRAPIVVRYTADGWHDTGFGAGGRVLLDLPAVQDEFVADMVPMPDGTVLLAGTAATPRTGQDPNVDRFVARLDAAGALDPTFGGGDGFVLLDNGAIAEDAVGVAFDEAGRIYVGGSTANAAGTAASVTLSRVSADGTPDHSFGTGGTATVPLPSGRDITNKVLRDAAGRFVFAATRVRNATTGTGTDRDFMAVRLTPAGAADVTFGPGGARVYDLGGTDHVADLHRGPGDTLVITGRSETGTGTRWAAVRI